MTEITDLQALLDVGADDAPAILTLAGETLTYGELRAQVQALADQLRALGVGPGDRIAIVLPNGPEMAITFLAAAVTGCAAPLNPKYREDEFRFYLDDLSARVLITLGDGQADAAPALAAAGVDTVPVTLTGTAGSLSLSAARPAGAPRTDRPGPDDAALVLHTSGTTSRPKIVPLRQHNLAASAASIGHGLTLGPQDRGLQVMPLFHIHGLIAGLLAPLGAGASIVCTDGFDAFKFLGWLERFRPTFYTAVPTMHQMVIARVGRHREQAANTSLRFIRSSSASLPAPVLEELEELFGVPVIEAYGMTEATHQMTSNPLPPGVTKQRSVGLPSGIEVAILDQAGTPQPVGERGEVCIKGATVIDAYESNPEANATAFTDGWFRTGDEGYLDHDGYLFLSGRLKEQINRGGEKISPLEVDERLLAHDAVAQAVTFGVPHPKLGEEVAAAVVLVDGANVGEAELRDFVGESLAGFKVPRQIIVLDELPKGATGKIQRIGLAEKLGLGS